MRQGKKPTVKKRMLLKKWRLNWENWLVIYDGPTEMVVRHRLSDKEKVLPRRNR